MVKYTQNNIYFSLYPLTENNTYCKAVLKTRSFGMFHFSASVS